jgi:hypothetical protein
VVASVADVAAVVAGAAAVVSVAAVVPPAAVPAVVALVLSLLSLPQATATSDTPMARLSSDLLRRFFMFVSLPCIGCSR